MEALKAEALKIQAEIEEFSSRTAKEVAVLLTEISSAEDGSDFAFLSKMSQNLHYWIIRYRWRQFH